MKVAISIPDDIFASADRLADRLGMTRGALYAHAMAELLKKYEEGRITERRNGDYAEEDGRLDPAVEAAQVRMLRRVEW